jgi:hypothetical protein
MLRWVGNLTLVHIFLTCAAAAQKDVKLKRGSPGGSPYRSQAPEMSHTTIHCMGFAFLSHWSGKKELALT